MPGIKAWAFAYAERK